MIQGLPDVKETDAATIMEPPYSIKAMHSAIGERPLRQQQAFLLRTWEGFSVKETADIMEIPEGSVKTHFSRAITTLRESLKDYE